jgi:hypothetical protein
MRITAVIALLPATRCRRPALRRGVESVIRYTMGYRDSQMAADSLSRSAATVRRGAEGHSAGFLARRPVAETSTFGRRYDHGRDCTLSRPVSPAPPRGARAPTLET